MEKPKGPGSGSALSKAGLQTRLGLPLNSPFPQTKHLCVQTDNRVCSQTELQFCLSSHTSRAFQLTLSLGWSFLATGEGTPAEPVCCYQHRPISRLGRATKSSGPASPGDTTSTAETRTADPTLPQPITFLSGRSFCRRHPAQPAQSPPSETETAESSLMWLPTAEHKLTPALRARAFCQRAVKNRSEHSPSPDSSGERKHIPVLRQQIQKKVPPDLWFQLSAPGAGAISPRYFQGLPQVACYSLRGYETHGLAGSWAGLY